MAATSPPSGASTTPAIFLDGAEAVRTGQGALRCTRAVTLPNSLVTSLPRRGTPSTIRSAAHSVASAVIA
jgi:hypothetical protein